MIKYDRIEINMGINKKTSQQNIRRRENAASLRSDVREMMRLQSSTLVLS